MKKIMTLILLLTLVAVVVASAQGAKPVYKQTAKFTVGGEGGWDYIT